jgi:hypothetical protein
MHGWRRALPLLVAAVLAGCGSGAGPGGGGDPGAILAAWQAFPAGANPRPLVITGGSVLGPQGGFPPGDAKLAFNNGEFDLAVALPAGPASSGGYPIISARAAFDRLGSAADPAKAGTSYRLPVVSASLGHARFDTDRGPRLLPAWRFGLARVTDPVWVLAVQPKALWTATPAPGPDLGFSATPTSDDRSLSLHFIGGPDEPTPCGIAYTTTAVESSTAVVVVLHEKPQRKADGEVACDAVGYPRTVALRLAAALGGRVLLSPSAALVPVSPG